MLKKIILERGLLLLGFLIFCTIIWWKIGSLDRVDRSLATMDVEIVGSTGQVVLFYEDLGEVVIKYCAPGYQTQSLDQNCRLLPGTEIYRVPIANFKEALKRSLWLPERGYGDTLLKADELTNKERAEGEERWRRKFDQRLSRAKIFARELGSDALESLGDGKGLPSDQLRINDVIDRLIDDLLSSSQIHRYSQSRNGNHFIFNLFSTFSKASVVLHSLSFEKISKGFFTMGSPSGEWEGEKRERGHQQDEKQVKVTISRDFEIMSLELTQMQWFLVMGSNPSHFIRPSDCAHHRVIKGESLCPRNPVDSVSWSAVQSFIRRLNDIQGLKGCRGTPQDPQGCYRLPTEAEWEYAARGGSQTTFFFGDDRGELGEYAWYRKNSGSMLSHRTYAVKQKKPNPFGLYDMYGNVSEWVVDEYDVRYFGGVDPLVDSGRESYRVIRGGSFERGEDFCRSAARNAAPTTGQSGFSGLGFRLVRQLD